MHGAPSPFASVRETVGGALRRMKKQFTQEQLNHLDLGQIEDFLTDSELETLASRHISFRVNVPVTLSIVRDTELKLEPFWLREAGFRTNGAVVKIGRGAFDVWEKDLPAGPIGLGVNSFSGGGRHYLVLLQSKVAVPPLKVTQLEPSGLRLNTFRVGVEPYVDRDDTVDFVPAGLEGRVLVQAAGKWVSAAKLLHLFRWTEDPSSRRPDDVLLTWSEDPRTTQTIQWRTGATVNRGYVAFERKARFERTGSLDRNRVRARTEQLTDRHLLNDPVVHRHTAVLRGLQPGTSYLYSVGNGQGMDWTKPVEFTTAPATAAPFSFIYLGDAQNGLDQWGPLLRGAFRAHPHVAFCILAGDLVNAGSARDEWESFFHNGRGVVDRRPLMPVIGNHDCRGGGPTLYLDQFELPRNGPFLVEAERVYTFEYSNALFLQLDSNLSPGRQTAWLERELSRSKALWKFVVYHHPASASASARDNLDVRETWTPLFDRYQVDMALQGHDHAYLRTYPLRGGQRVDNPASGTTYVVSYSGTKAYPQDAHAYAQIGFTNVPTYQVLDVAGRRLTYRAFDQSGRVRDELLIEK